MTVIALGTDPGLATFGIAVVDYESRRCFFAQTVYTQSCARTTYDRVGEIVTVLRSLPVEFEVIGYERQQEAWYGHQKRGETNVHATKARIGEGIICTAGNFLGVQAHAELSPGMIRKELGLAPSAPKEEIRARVNLMIKGLPRRMSSHAYDAVAIAYATSALFTKSRRQELRKARGAEPRRQPS